MATPNKHWTDQLNELSGSNNSGAFVAFRKIPGIARNEKIGPSGFSTFIEAVIRFIRRLFEPAIGFNQLARAADDRQRVFGLGRI